MSICKHGFPLVGAVSLAYLAYDNWLALLMTALSLALAAFLAWAAFGRRA